MREKLPFIFNLQENIMLTTRTLITQDRKQVRGKIEYTGYSVIVPHNMKKLVNK